MAIEPIILTDTDLCQLVFDVIELALHVTSVSLGATLHDCTHTLTHI